MTSNKQKNNSGTLLDPFVDIAVEGADAIAGLIHLSINKSIENFINSQKNKKNVKPVLDNYRHVSKNTINVLAIGYSVSTKKDLFFTSIPWRRHTWILGGSGFGKSNCFTLLMENAIKSNNALMQIDPKGTRSEIEQFKKLNKFYKRDYYVFSEIESSPRTYNPLLGKDNTQRTILIMRSLKWSEVYYQTMAETAIQESLEEMEEVGVKISIPNLFRHLLEFKNNKETSGLISQLRNIVKSPFGKLLEDHGNAVNMWKIREEKKSLYVGLSTQGYGEIARSVGKLFINDLQITSHQIGITYGDSHLATQNMMSVFIDEAGSILYTDFIDYLNKTRSSGFEVYIAMQTPADAEAIGPQFKDHIIELCSNLIVLKQGNDKYATEISNCIGTFSTIAVTKMTIDGLDGDRGSKREVNERLVWPQTIKDLGIGQAIISSKAPNELHFVNLRDLRNADFFKTPLTIGDVTREQIIKEARENPIFIDVFNNNTKADEISLNGGSNE